MRSLLNKSSQEQDLQILHSLIQKYMADDWNHTTIIAEKKLAKELLIVTDPVQIINKMWVFMNQDIESRRYNILRIFEQGPFSQYLQKNIDNYFQEVYLPWVLGNEEQKNEIEDRYRGVHEFKPSYRGVCRTKNFEGEHPEIIKTGMEKLKEKFNNQLSKYNEYHL